MCVIARNIMLEHARETIHHTFEYVRGATCGATMLSPTGVRAHPQIYKGVCSRRARAPQTAFDGLVAVLQVLAMPQIGGCHNAWRAVVVVAVHGRALTRMHASAHVCVPRELQHIQGPSVRKHSLRRHSQRPRGNRRDASARGASSNVLATRPTA